MMLKNVKSNLKSVTWEQRIAYVALFLVCFFFTLFTFQWHNYPFYFWISLLACGIMIFSLILRKGFFLIRSVWINLLFIGILLTLIPAYVCEDLPEAYFFNAHGMPLRLLLTYVMILFIQSRLHSEQRAGKSFSVLSVVRAGFKFAFLLQIFWIPIQFILYKAFDLNLNEFIFNDLLKRVYNASMNYVSNGQVLIAPSGFTWHSALIAPMLCLALLLFENNWLRLLIVIDAFLCRSSTALVGTLITLVLLILFAFIKKKITFKKIFYKIRHLKFRHGIIIGVVLLALILLGVRFSLFDRVPEELSYLWKRFTWIFTLPIEEQEIHVQYFYYGWNAWLEASPLRKIFGFGYYASGYPLESCNALLMQYRGSAVECDVVNILLSTGLFGFVTFYGFLIVNMIRSFKVDYRNFIFLFAVFIMGFGYNIQWEYTIFTELLIYVCALKKRSFFQK